MRNESSVKSILIVAVAVCVSFVLGAVVFAQPPVNVGDRHGNMRAAQQLIQQAWEKVNEEIKMSAEAANAHH
jgi:hypothetical protein